MAVAVAGERMDEQLAFEAAFTRVSRSAFLLARNLGRTSEEASDIVQEAALRAWRYRSKRTGDFRPWFLAIVYRQARGRRPDWLPLPPGWDRPAPEPIETSLDPNLMAALCALPRRQRTALWLRYCDDLTTTDVARILRCSEPATKQLLLRAREALRRKLEEIER